MARLPPPCPPLVPPPSSRYEGTHFFYLTQRAQVYLLLLFASWFSNRLLQSQFQLHERLIKHNVRLVKTLKTTKAELHNEKTTVRTKAVLREHLNGILDSSYISPEELLLAPEPLGSGSSGVVFRAWYKGTQVVVKKLNKRFLKDPVQVKSFRDLIVFQINLRHPHIVQLMGASWNAEHSFIGVVMEYMHRGTLAPIINDNTIPLEWYGGLGSGMTLDVSLGMAYLHQRKICHHDLTSSKLLVTEYWRCKLGNFAESRSEEDTVSLYNIQWRRDIQLHLHL